MSYEPFGLVTESGQPELRQGRTAFLALLSVKPGQQISSQHPWDWHFPPGA